MLILALGDMGMYLADVGGRLISATAFPIDIARGKSRFHLDPQRKRTSHCLLPERDSYEYPSFVTLSGLDEYYQPSSIDGRCPLPVAWSRLKQEQAQIEHHQCQNEQQHPEKWVSDPGYQNRKRWLFLYQ